MTSPKHAPGDLTGAFPAKHPIADKSLSHSLKRSLVSRSGSPSHDVPPTKTAKRSFSANPRDLQRHDMTDNHHGGQDAEWEEGDPTDDPSSHLANQSAPAAKSTSLLEVAASVFNQGENMTPVKNPVAGRGFVGTRIPIRSSPRGEDAGAEQSDVARPRVPSDPRVPSGAQLLHSVALGEYLQLDERPTFVVDVMDEMKTIVGLPILFGNAALKSRPALLDHVQGRSEDPTMLLDLGTSFSDFKAWVSSPAVGSDLVSTFPFAGLLWQSSLIRKRLKVIHGHSHPFSPAPMHEIYARGHMQQFKGLGSVSSSGTGRGDIASTGYFDLPARTSGRIPNALQDMVIDVSDASAGSPEPLSPVSAGDVKCADLLSGSASPIRDQKPQITSTGTDTELLVPIGDKGCFDWTRLPISPSLPSHVQFARGVNWAGTSLGPIENWPPDLRGMCNLIMASPHPSAMYWGYDHIAIYNEAYVLLAGQKHPQLMGMRYRDAWAEIWDAIEDVFDSAFKNAQATMKDDDCLFIMRNGFLEETYFSWSIIPLIGDDGSVVGLYNPAFEKTRRKIAERRMLTLREIGERIAAARKVPQFWALLLEGLEFNEYDAPMVLVYSLNEDTSDNDAASSTSSGGASNKVCFLEGALGIPPGHKAAPEVIDMKTGTAGFASSFRQALTTDRPIVLRVDDGTLQAEMLEGIEWRGFGDPSKIVVIAPVRPTTGESTLGFLVMATNPRRPYDEDYDLFVQLLGRQLATSIASVVLFEEEIKKGERAAQLAAQDRIELNNQLVARTQQAVEAENKFTRMAELAPVGIFIGDADGKINFVNDAWYSITSFPRDLMVEDEWIEYVADEDQPKVREAWKTMLDKRCAVSLEFRFKTPWRDKPGNTGLTWVLTSASPERDEDGQTHRIFGSMTDISAQKFAESLQTRRMEEAVELKRQQERYIDTTSHEMRNPLSAILQCADSITTSLGELAETTQLSGPQKDILELTIDSAQTITLCAQHQKRIVDDVLTLSKLDSAMMAVSPTDTQPITVVHRVLKMFDAELKTNDIKLDINIDRSYANLRLDWVRLDPHRLSQVLINLMTNAIKFTARQETRVVRMHIGASKSKPSQEDKWRLTYIPSRSLKDKDVTAGGEWGLGEPLFVHFAVQDTGSGLDDLEKKQLFQRFSQASPRTHVTYGGSGLGLFISRELVELQGGEIGVASQSGKGSIFAFYVKARRSPDPDGKSDGESASQKKSTRPALLPNLSTPNISSAQTTQSIPPKSNASSKVLLSAPVHVLVVEDNLINQKVLATQLRKIGCVVYVANHGGEAIDKIRQSKFYRERVTNGLDIDVVLMDLEMPVMDGQTCAKKLREMQSSGELVAHIPVIAVTANARAEQIEMTLKSGIDDVVSKPFRIPDLVPKIKDVIEKVSKLEGTVEVRKPT
ncbi:sensory transduction histidine kinase [Exophiala viscosa]|uniref:Sensory transduction histidine kinase n=1 Tax=Exophiala viscosa TaxID=2486360 RepID=A0AAN6I9Q4_9EURO|nr:sensory transduction histidine kinase [Exophiala viscosa]KAI1620615.1 sensory transduction histidine kinase [Exophiala viscosa]